MDDHFWCFLATCLHTIQNNELYCHMCVVVPLPSTLSHASHISLRKKLRCRKTKKEDSNTERITFFGCAMPAAWQKYLIVWIQNIIPDWNTWLFWFKLIPDWKTLLFWFKPSRIVHGSGSPFWCILLDFQSTHWSKWWKWDTQYI